MQDVEKNIDTIVKTYHDKWKEMNGAALLHTQNQLATYSYFFTEIVHEEEKDYIEKYGKYLWSKATKWLRIRKGDSSKSIWHIDQEVTTDTIVERTDQMFAEARVKYLKDKVSMIRRVLDSVNNRLTDTRQERKLSAK